MIITKEKIKQYSNDRIPLVEEYNIQVDVVNWAECGYTGNVTLTLRDFKVDDNDNLTNLGTYSYIIDKEVYQGGISKLPINNTHEQRKELLYDLLLDNYNKETIRDVDYKLNNWKLK